MSDLIRDGRDWFDKARRSKSQGHSPIAELRNAIAAFSKAWELNPADSAARRHRGEAYRQLGYAESDAGADPRESFHRAIDDWPQGDTKSLSFLSGIYGSLAAAEEKHDGDPRAAYQKAFQICDLVIGLMEHAGLPVESERRRLSHYADCLKTADARFRDLDGSQAHLMTLVEEFRQIEPPRPWVIHPYTYAFLENFASRIKVDDLLPFLRLVPLQEPVDFKRINHLYWAFMRTGRFAEMETIMEWMLALIEEPGRRFDTKLVVELFLDPWAKKPEEDTCARSRAYLYRLLAQLDARGVHGSDYCEVQLWLGAAEAFLGEREKAGALLGRVNQSDLESDQKGLFEQLQRQVSASAEKDPRM